jgi:probable HAF family extracellular repeat protein
MRAMKVATALAVLVAAPAWATTNLGAPPGHPDAFVQAVAVNASGAAVAIGSEGVGTNTPRQQAFVWRKSKKTALAYRGSHFIEPSAIDGAGNVIGHVGNTAVLWRKGVPTALGRFQPNGMSGSGAFVVGQGFRSGDPHAFAWENGTLTDLPGLGGTETRANAVSDSGTIVGQSALPSGVDHAVVWHAGVATDLGSIGNLDSYATLLGRDGTIFGFASTHVGNARNVLEWKRGRLIVLGRFGAGGARPVAVSAHGDLLVQTETADQNAIGLRLLRDGKTIRITVPALGRQTLWAVGLDDEDDVVGYGTTTLRGFLWRNGRATLLPADEQPVAIAGGWIVASKSSSGAALLMRLRG